MKGEIWEAFKQKYPFPAELYEKQEKGEELTVFEAIQCDVCAKAFRYFSEGFEACRRLEHERRFRPNEATN